MWIYLELHDIIYYVTRLDTNHVTTNFGRKFPDKKRKSYKFMIDIKIITAENKSDINIPNEPFKLFGKMIPSYLNEQWNYSVNYLEENAITEMCFPDENYNFDDMQKNSVFIGAYGNDKCIGLAIMQDAWFKYMYLYDLKVSTAYRSKGVATALIQKATDVCKERGYSGIYTQGQDNNLAACLFYIKSGFHIGGLDTNVYKGTKQEGKSDIIFYLDC